jgi:MoaA/NifB/PqqE/SkfB family radical SAM enzyme
MQQVREGKDRGCDHSVIVGWGEPTLWPHLVPWVEAVKNEGMTSSIITNGTADPEYYQDLFDAGINHLHLSIHGIGSVINKISGSSAAAGKQMAIMEYLKETKLPWRSNTTLQQDNYKQLPEIVQTIIDHGAYHVVLLNFLPHYEWSDPEKLRQVAVDPRVLAPLMEQCIDMILDAGRFVTLRYFPMCHLKPKYWPYVTNARYVLYDPGEWDNGHCGEQLAKLWRSACELGDGVAITTSPCLSCALRIHCGGWNKIYASGFDGAGLTPLDISIASILDLGREFFDPGYLFDQNPFNATRGYV